MENQPLKPTPDTQRHKGSPQRPVPPPSPWRGGIAWGLALIFLIAWNIIAGDQISGSFAKPLLWPEPKQPTTSSPPSNSKTSAETKPKGDQSSSTASTTYSEFQTTFPSVIGDPNLVSTLEAHKVVVDVVNSSRLWVIELLANWLPTILLLGFFWWIGKKATQNQVGLFGLGCTKARHYSEDQSKITFDDVAGVDEAKSDLQEEVDFLRHPLKYHNAGARIPRGVLLVGPPGTGKTLLARAVAGEAGVPFFSLSASEFVEMFVGVGASHVRDLFNQAKAAAPAIVFIDELDAVGRRRGAGIGRGNDEREQTLNQLLVEMDGFDAHHEVIVLAATNRPDVLDPALLRPGRFDRQVVVGLPDRKGREGILRIHTRNLRLSANVDLSVLARSTKGFSGADLANLCNEAALLAARHDRSEVLMDDFGEAQDKVLLGGARPSLADPSERRVVAYHESGHALVAWLTPAADPVHKVTIVPHGRALGVTEQLPSDDHYNYGATYLMARLAVMLGGRTADRHWRCYDRSGE
jgi:cell division protease FtsH